MNKLKMMFVCALLIVLLVGPAGCKKAEIPTVDDVLGSWEIKAWTWTEPAYYKSYDMRGTLEFTAYSYDGRPYYRVHFLFSRDGSPKVLTGSAQLNGLPVIHFDCFGSGFPDHLGFRGIVEDGGMIGRGGFFSDIRTYEHWEWEARKIN